VRQKSKSSASAATWHTPRSRKLRATAVTWGLAPGAAASERRQGGLSRWQSLRRRLPRREICFSSALDESFHRCRKVCWLAPHVNGERYQNLSPNLRAKGRRLFHSRWMLLHAQRDQRIDASRAARGKVASEQRDGHQQQRDAHIRE